MRRGQDQGRHEAADRVRPYVRTAGRTRAAALLRLETLVSTTAAGTEHTAQLGDTEQAICRLCTHPTSVAEIGATLRLPFGVARVLVGDLVEQRWLAVHTDADSADRPSAELLQRVLDGLHRL